MPKKKARAVSVVWAPVYDVASIVDMAATITFINYVLESRSNSSFANVLRPSCVCMTDARTKGSPAAIVVFKPACGQMPDELRDRPFYSAPQCDYRLTCCKCEPTDQAHRKVYCASAAIASSKDALESAVRTSADALKEKIDPAAEYFTDSVASRVRMMLRAQTVASPPPPPVESFKKPVFSKLDDLMPCWATHTVDSSSGELVPLGPKDVPTSRSQLVRLVFCASVPFDGTIQISTAQKSASSTSSGRRVRWA